MFSSLVLAVILHGSGVSLDPTMVCHYSQATDDISGRWMGGFPTRLILATRLKGFDVPIEVYNAGVVPRCNYVYDADRMANDGSPTREICGPGFTPTCGNWTP